MPYPVPRSVPNGEHVRVGRMIICNEQGHLPDLLCTPAPLPADKIPTLTEVATFAIYGAPLSVAVFKARRQQAISECWDLWHHPNGPGDMVPHLKAIQAKEKPPAGDDGATAREQRANVEQWLVTGRKKDRPRPLSETAQEQKSRLKTMSNKEAIEYALQEADRAEQRDRNLDQKAKRFYEALGVATLQGEVVLKGLSEYVCDDPQRERPPLSPGRRALCDDDYCSLLVHSLDTNEIDIDPPWTLDEAIFEIFDRRARIAAEMRLIWKDLRISRDHAQLLLSQLGHAPMACSHQSAVIKGRRFEKSDAPLRTKMKEMIDGGTASTVWEAAGLMAKDAKGTSLEASQFRLSRQFLADHPNYSSRGGIAPKNSG